MITSGIEFQEVSPKKYGIENCIGAIKTEERVLNLENARCYFKESLKDNLRYQIWIKERYLLFK